MSDTYFRHALPAGEILGEYEVVSVLGAGGFGVTYLVRHRTLGDRFAMKEYFPQSLAERESGGTVVVRTNTFEDTFYKGLHGFLEEARIVRRLRGHPNVVQVNSFFELNNTAYMVMEYYEGQSLTAFRRQAGDAFDEATMRRLLGPVLDALEYVHQREVVHRDLKPDNIFLCEDGRPILLDFGASRFAAAGGTVPMTAVLTPGFAPPEQYISEDSGETILRQGPWTDLYALAATLHMLASGRAPYDAMSRQMSGTDPQPPAHTRLPGYSPAFCNAIDACLRLDMRQRPQSIAEFRAIWNDTSAVTPVATQAVPRAPLAPPVAAPGTQRNPTSAPPQMPTAPTAPNAAPTLQPAPAAPVSKSKLPLIAGLLVLLAGAGVGLWWFLRPAASGGAAAVAPAPVASIDKGVLLIFTDTACQLELNGSAQGQLQPAKSLRVEVQPGEQAIDCIGIEDPNLGAWMTKTVAPGQQAVVELVLVSAADAAAETADAATTDTAEGEPAAEPEEAATGATVEEMLADFQLTEMNPPEFNGPNTEDPGPGEVIGKQVSKAGADAADVESWFASNGISLWYAPGPTSLAPRPSWTAGFEIPSFVPTSFAGQPLIKVIDSADHILSLYGPDFASARILLAQKANDGTPEYALDFASYVNAPERIEADRDFVGQQIVWAQQVSNVLYVSHGHSTYAKSSYGKNAYISAFDTADGFMTLWHSPAQVSNANNFLVDGEYLISGYGFTDEPDYLYTLNAVDGTVIGRVPVKSGPDFLAFKDDKLYVRAYDTDYVFELK